MTLTGRDATDARRALPSVDEVLKEPAIAGALARHGRGPVVRAARAVLYETRTALGNGRLTGRAPSSGELAETAASRLASETAPSLVRVINATGVVVHTNLGRAPLPAEALAAIANVATGYSNLEYDLASGDRGNRETHAESSLRRLLDVEAAVVVNNCAAAVLLAVNTFAENRDVLVSRGELVEIGGSFRIPEILQKGGARLREVGTTNRTRLSDYEKALSSDTGLILRVHPSNFRIVGFTQSPSLRELAELARSASVPLVEDLGSGLLAPPPGLEQEPTVRQSLDAGADIVTFSGDKLLGGPQAGLIAGRVDRVDALRRNPLYRALRVDKMTIAALHATLALHESERAASSVPVLRMLSADPAELRRRAEALAEGVRLAGFEAQLVPGHSAAGGGAAPLSELPTTLVAIEAPAGADALAARLRAGHPPVVARIENDRVVLDPRTVDPGDDGVLGEALLAALR